MKNKRLITLVLTIALLLSTLVLLTQAIDLTTGPTHDARSVISEELLHILECRELQRFRTANNMATVELPMEDTLPISVWLTGIDEDAVEAAALEETGLNKERIRELSSEGVILESEEVDAYIEAERRIYSERQRAANEAFVTSKATTVATFSSEASNSESDRFISAYAPMVVTDATDEEIWSLAEDSAVESITYEPDMEIELASSSTTGQGETRAYYVRDTLGYTGKGVKIGQIEPALPKLDTLPSGQVTLNGSNPSNPNDMTLCNIDHATAVAEIMISIGNRTTGSATRGIAPDASLYCTAFSTTEELYSGIEWLLTQGANVINMSANLYYGRLNSVSYTGQADNCWIEHLAITHSVHFVVSAGNFTEGGGYQIGAPALAYNVITVGNLDTSSGSAESGHILHSSSNYIDDPNHANKPDLVAPGTSICTSSFLTAEFPKHGNLVARPIIGTSFAAPIVTGIVAQILEQNPGLKTQQDTVKAILTCAINHSKIRYTSDSTEFEKYGAGCVDARGPGYVARVHQYKGDHFDGNASAGSTKEYTFTVKSTDDLKRISLTWLKRTTINGSHTTIYPPYSEGNVAKLRLEIFGPNGNRVANAVPSTGGNLVIIQLDNPAAGTYKIRVTLETPSDQRVNFAVAWW